MLKRTNAVVSSTQAKKKTANRLSVIIPTKDEPYIRELVSQIGRVVPVPHEILVVDKSAFTPSVPGAIVIKQTTDGLGNAFLEGLSVANGDIVILMDGDGSHRPQDIPRILEALTKADIVIGSKFVAGGKTSDSFSRRVVSRAFAFMTRTLLQVPVKDPLSGFAAFRRKVFRDLVLKPKGFKIVLEILYKSGATVAEVPISFEERKAGTSKAGWKLAGIKEVLNLFLLLLTLLFTQRGRMQARKKAPRKQ